MDVKETLGQKCWQALIKNQTIYNAAKEKCNKSIGSIECGFDWVKPYLNKIICDFCESDLVSVSEDSLNDFYSVELKCRNCDKAISNIPIYIAEMIAEERDDLEELKQGWSNTAMCPCCNEGCFIKNENVCLSCEYQPENLNCRFCDTETDIEDLDSSKLCSYCNYKLSKND